MCNKITELCSFRLICVCDIMNLTRSAVGGLTRAVAHQAHAHSSISSVNPGSALVLFAAVYAHRKYGF
jgi:hypothetical protein